MVAGVDADVDSRAEKTSGAGEGIPSSVDVIVIGAGPAGLSISRCLGEKGLDVLCVDPHFNRPWPNNYGVWEDELLPLGLADCSLRTWEKTTIYTRNGEPKTVLNRPYIRVDRAKLKQRLLDACKATDRVKFLEVLGNRVDSNTNPNFNVVEFASPNTKDILGFSTSRLVIDATGHALRFTEVEDEEYKPAYQAAYGIEVVLEEDMTAYAHDEMLLMDYRDEHMQSNAVDRKLSQEEPAFVYVMPMDRRRVFFEETSLIANTAVSFESLKERLLKRLKHHGVTNYTIVDEELSLIPMGGSIPDVSQRVLAFGGAASFVHPATGYMIARTLTRAEPIARIISSALKTTPTSADTAKISREVWARVWNRAYRRQRCFFEFGGEVLASIDLDGTRDFFDAFFKLPEQVWFDFLTFKLESPYDRLQFALGVFFNASNRIRTQLVWDSMTKGNFKFFSSVLPILGKVLDENEDEISGNVKEIQKNNPNAAASKRPVDISTSF